MSDCVDGMATAENAVFPPFFQGLIWLPFWPFLFGLSSLGRNADLNYISCPSFKGKHSNFPTNIQCLRLSISNFPLRFFFGAFPNGCGAWDEILDFHDMVSEKA